MRSISICSNEDTARCESQMKAVTRRAGIANCRVTM